MTSGPIVGLVWRLYLGHPGLRTGIATSCSPIVCLFMPITQFFVPICLTSLSISAISACSWLRFSRSAVLSFLLSLRFSANIHFLPTFFHEPRLLRYFLTFVGNLPGDQRSAASDRLDLPLRLAFISMLVGALDRDNYWAGPSLFLPASNLMLLRDSEASSFPVVAWKYGASRGSFSSQDVFERSTAVQHAGLCHMSRRM